jgi:transcriptional regulator with XRE-family HTH domain
MVPMTQSPTISPEALQFGATIRRVRLARGWTLVRLGREIGMHPRYLGVVESGRNDTSLTTIVAICHALGADIGEVMREVAAVHVPRQRPK